MEVMDSIKEQLIGEDNDSVTDKSEIESVFERHFINLFNVDDRLRQNWFDEDIKSIQDDCLPTLGSLFLLGQIGGGFE
ncbi:hypothetical protein QJS10_CPA09g00381 [Acorus calamus]|uniref:Uncharacterized protein n=1 Tax=Acorus calamus TaxID=4465 RepID=A0AAV9E404_ACOCL|nr:hypothetical protein QJS10_CPA09g00381 [Acorus calamus]